MQIFTSLHSCLSTLPVPLNFMSHWSPLSYRNIYPYVWVPHTFSWVQALIPFVTPQSSCQQYCLFLSGIKLGKMHCLYLDIQLTYKAFYFSILKWYEIPWFASPHLTAPMPVHMACAFWSLQFPFGFCFCLKKFISLVWLNC